MRFAGPVSSDFVWGRLTSGCDGQRWARSGGHGFLLGVEYVDPRDGESFLPAELGVAGRLDDVALDNGLVILSTQPTGDGYAGDQSLFAPAFTAGEDELAEMVSRFAAVVRDVAEAAERELASEKPVPQPVPATDAQ